MTLTSNCSIFRGSARADEVQLVFLKSVLLPRSRIDLEEWEHVTCMKTVALRSQETVSGLKGYIAAGTCLMQGEEVTCRGRVSAQYCTNSIEGRSKCALILADLKWLLGRRMWVCLSKAGSFKGPFTK